jgi:hypothetical protein
MDLYVGILRDSINVYDAAADGDAPPIRSIRGPSTKLDGVTDLVLDPVGNLYEGNAATSTVNVYPPGAAGDAPPIRTIAGSQTGLGVPGGVALDSNGNLYVLNTGGIPINRTITVYAPGADGNSAPIRTLTGIQVADGNLNAIAIDQLDNLYLAEDLPEIISVYPPGANGAVIPIRTISGISTGLKVPSKMAFDASNNLYVANGLDVLVFTSDATGDVPPLRRIAGPHTAISNAFDLAVDESGEIYVGNFSAQFTDGSVTVYPAWADGDVAPVRTITGIDTGLGVPSGGIALVPPPVTPPTPRPPWWRRLSLAELVAILIFGGVTVDGGGWVVLPGGPPIPVGPWETGWANLLVAKRDAMLGLALDELAKHIEDPGARESVRRAVLETVRSRVETLLETPQAGRRVNR